MNELHISNKAGGYFETALVPYLSTENTEFHIGQPNSKRVDKEKFISQYPETYNRLYVCWREVLKNDYNGKWVNTESSKINCGTCYKCKRTMLALDILGKKDDYSGVFDWSLYDKQRDALVGFALANNNKKGKEYWTELCQLMEESNFVIPNRAKWLKVKFARLYKLRLQELIQF